jgi:1,4-alpha-glucan branching enzyme
MSEVGTFCLVLHSHLPWLAHHGTWPVGEEWLYQAWAASYLPVLDVLESLAGEGRRDLVTLGVTPVLAAQLDDPHCLRQMHTWLGLWQTRACELAARPEGRELSAYEFGLASAALASFESRWRHGASPVLRRLADAGAVELLGGPATHPFLPLLDDRVASFALRVGSDDALLRLGRRPDGIWSPECGYAPGLERVLRAGGVSHFPVDEATLAVTGRTTALGWDVAGSGVVTFARHLGITNRIWSSRHGYPSGGDYRDFHAQDDLGFRLRRVTSPDTTSDKKAPYEPDRAAAAVERDAADFVGAVRRHLAEVADTLGRPGLVVAAYDTELFGHWWHEGPAFLGAVLRMLPRAGVRVSTLAGAARDGLVGGTVELGPGSWGAGKDFSVWAGPAVADLEAENAEMQRRLLRLVANEARSGGMRTRRPDLDQLAREALLRLSSDWAFMVSRDSAAAYARERASIHLGRFTAIAEAIEDGDASSARGIAEAARVSDAAFPHVDARGLLHESAAEA